MTCLTLAGVAAVIEDDTPSEHPSRFARSLMSIVTKPIMTLDPSHPFLTTVRSFREDFRILLKDTLALAQEGLDN